MVTEHSLARASRKFLVRTREIEELPQLAPGTVLVFEVDSGYVAFNERRHLAGREDVVVNAVSVSLVDVRDRLVRVPFAVPSSSPADDFTVLVDFQCRVVRPESVAEQGLSNLVGLLRTYLRQNSALAPTTGSFSVEDIAQVRKEVPALIEAYCRMRSPQIDGMRIELAGVLVRTPADLANHERDMRDLDWKHRKENREYEAEDRNAARLEGYFHRGPEAVAGLAVANHQLNLGEATEREYEMQAQKRAEIIKIIQALPEGALDTVAVNGERLIEHALDGLLSPKRGTGALPPRDLSRAQLDRHSAEEEPHD
ncbi:hypothetical protein [Amycolatopsis sp. NPDC059657]|uniref:hypothetical protein n=1 Tax=Amycolatopsis sp. NPDC059657 TaxID=3346899 RepID=UPI00366DEF57